MPFIRIFVQGSHEKKPWCPEKLISATSTFSGLQLALFAGRSRLKK
jgi:hypothetical protein